MLQEKASQWILTTKDKSIAVNKYGENGVVQIDLNKVNTKISDVSNGFPKTARMTNWAKRDQGVFNSEQDTSKSNEED